MPDRLLVIEDDKGFQPGGMPENFEIAVAGDQCGMVVKALLSDQGVCELRLCASA